MDDQTFATIYGVDFSGAGLAGWTAWVARLGAPRERLHTNSPNFPPWRRCAGRRSARWLCVIAAVGAMLSWRETAHGHVAAHPCYRCKL